MAMMMQQYGNNLSTPYGAQDYSPFFNARNSYTTNLVWVQGIEGAKALMLQPNAKVICLDSEIENRAYIKIADELGATKLRKFELHEITDEVEKLSYELSEYVRKDELQQLINDLLKPREEVKENESIISTTQPTVDRRALAAPTK